MILDLFWFVSCLYLKNIPSPGNYGCNGQYDSVFITVFMVIMNNIMIEFNFSSLILREFGKNITHLFCLGEVAFIIHFFKDVGKNR